MLELTPVLTENERERIYQSAIKLLKEVGLVCNHEETIKYFAAAGCSISKGDPKHKNAKTVRFTEAIITAALDKVPKQYTLYPTSPGYKEMPVGNGERYFCNEGGDYVRDMDTGKLRPAEIRDQVAMSRLISACEHIDSGISPTYWFYDLVPQDRYDKFGLMGIYEAIACLHNGKSKIQVYSTATATEVPDVIKTWQICAGGEDEFRKKPNATMVVTPLSPLFLPGRTEENEPWGMADSLMVSAKAGVPITIGVCGLLGMSGPITVAGLITQSVAETLAINVAIQAVNPGNIVSLNDYTGVADMNTGGKHETRPEANLVHLGLTSMAHYLKLAIATINCPGSVEADAQMAWEYMSIALSQYLAGTDMIAMFGGLSVDDVFDYRALLMGNEIISWVKHFAKGFDTTENTIPLDMMIEVGPAPAGGNFLKTKETLKLYKDIMWKPSNLTNRLSRDAWIEQGMESISERATEMAREILKSHEPSVPEYQQKQLREFILETLSREGVRGDEAKKIIELTYYSA